MVASQSIRCNSTSTRTLYPLLAAHTPRADFLSAQPYQPCFSNYLSCRTVFSHNNSERKYTFFLAEAQAQAQAQSASRYGLGGMIGGAPVGMIGNLQRPSGALGTLGSGVVGTPGAFAGVGAMQMNSKLPSKPGTKTVQGRMQPDAHSQALGQAVGQVQGQHRGRMGDQHTDNSWADANNMAAQPGAAMRKLHGLDVSKLVDMEQVRLVPCAFFLLFSMSVISSPSSLSSKFFPSFLHCMMPHTHTQPHCKSACTNSHVETVQRRRITCGGSKSRAHESAFTHACTLVTGNKSTT